MLSGLSPNAIRAGLLLYLLGMASAVVAVLTVQWVGKRQPIAQHSAASPSEPGLALQMQEISAKLGELKQELVHRQAIDFGAASQRVPADASAAGTDTRWNDRLQQLSQDVKQILDICKYQRSVADISKGPPLKGSAWLDQAIADLPADGFREATKRLLEEHRLWSVQEIVENYGPPSNLRMAPGVLVLIYESSVADRLFEFHCMDGIVINVVCGM